MKKTKSRRNRFMRIAGTMLLLAALPVLVFVLIGCPAEASPGSDGQTLTYTVTYDGNGNTSGNEPIDANRYLPGATVLILANTGSLAKTDFNFIGWNTGSNGNGTNYLPSSSYIMENSDVVMYANWRPTRFFGNGNTGFGGPVGEGELDIHNTGNTLNFTLIKGNSDLTDTLVIYIDSVPGGFTDTTSINDSHNDARKAISGYDGGVNYSNLTFGFDADYAIVYTAGNGGFLFRLVAGGDGSLDYISTLGGAGLSSDAAFSFETALSDIGIAQGDQFKFVVTYLNAANAFRSNEAIGDGMEGISNPGASSITFSCYRMYTSTF